MFTIVIMCKLKEACIRKGFRSSLIGMALQWYTKIPNNSICCFAQLTTTFVEQFSNSWKSKRDSQYLNTIMQGSRETLRAYIALNKEKVEITNLNMKTFINAFLKGMHYDLDLCTELTKYPCKRLQMSYQK